VTSFSGVMVIILDLVLMGKIKLTAFHFAVCYFANNMHPFNTRYNFLHFIPSFECI